MQGRGAPRQWERDGQPSLQPEVHPKNGDQPVSVDSVTAQHHARQARPQPTGTTASSVIAKMVTAGIPGHGVDWVSPVDDSVTDHRNCEITLATLIGIGLVITTLSKLRNA